MEFQSQKLLICIKHYNSIDKKKTLVLHHLQLHEWLMQFFLIISHAISYQTELYIFNTIVISHSMESMSVISEIKKQHLDRCLIE